MKKSRLLYLIPLLTTVLAGCSNNSQPSIQESSVNEDPNNISLFNFEGWGAGYQTICLQNNFGKVSRNTNMDYVKEGKESALLQPLGNYSNTSLKPAIYWPLLSNTFGYNYCDLTHFVKMEFDVYNASDADINMTVGFVASVNSIKEVAFGKGEEFTISSNSWMHIVYEPDISKLATYVNIEEAKGFYLMFPNAKTPDINKAPKIYVDDIRMITQTEPRVINDIFKIKPNEICDFEDEAAYNHITITNVAPEQLKYEIIEATDEVKPTRGTKMLHVMNKGNKGRWVNWSFLMFSGAYMNKTDLVKIPEEELIAGLWSIKYDIQYRDHGANLYEGMFFPKFYSKSGGDLYIPTKNITNNKWISITLPLCTDITYDVTQKANISSDYVLKNDGFGWTIGNEETDIDIYIDNIRIYKNAN